MKEIVLGPSWHDISTGSLVPPHTLSQIGSETDEKNDSEVRLGSLCLLPGVVDKPCWPSYHPAQKSPWLRSIVAGTSCYPHPHSWMQRSWVENATGAELDPTRLSGTCGWSSRLLIFSKPLVHESQIFIHPKQLGWRLDHRRKQTVSMEETGGMSGWWETGKKSLW